LRHEESKSSGGRSAAQVFDRAAAAGDLATAVALARPAVRRALWTHNLDDEGLSLTHLLCEHLERPANFTGDLWLMTGP
jgi:hypothetical protein